MSRTAASSSSSPDDTAVHLEDSAGPSTAASSTDELAALGTSSQKRLPTSGISPTKPAKAYPKSPRRSESLTGNNPPRRSIQIAESSRGDRPSAHPHPSRTRGRKSRNYSEDVGYTRRSLSLGRGTAGQGSRASSQPRNPLNEPRRSIGKRPEEFDLKARDPHAGGQGGAFGKGVQRTVPFAAPYARSGIVLSTPSKWSDWLIPGPLTKGWGQLVYLIVGQSLVAAIISGAANFGVACATYNHYERSTVIKLWQWIPVPLAGDMGVTVIIQQIVSMIITSALVHHDLSAPKGPVGPLRRPWPPLLHLPSSPSPNGSWLGTKLSSEVPEHSPLYMGKAQGSSRVKQYFLWFVRSVLTGSERNDLLASGITWRQRLERLLWTAVQGFFLCVLTFWWFWPISIAIVAPIYEHENLSGTYIPAIIKLLYGAIMGLLTNPIMALMAMGAESSVRRGYPELELWKPFGGEEDYNAWLMEHQLNRAEVEIGPRGVARRSISGFGQRPTTAALGSADRRGRSENDVSTIAGRGGGERTEMTQIVNGYR